MSGTFSRHAALFVSKLLTHSFIDTDFYCPSVPWCCRVYMLLASLGLLIWFIAPVASQSFDLELNNGEVGGWIRE